MSAPSLDSIPDRSGIFGLPNLRRELAPDQRDADAATLRRKRVNRERDRLSAALWEHLGERWHKAHHHPQVTNIVVNEDGRVLAKTYLSPEWHEIAHLEPDEVMNACATLVEMRGESLNDNYFVSGHVFVDDIKVRVEAVLPPVSDGAPTITWRLLRKLDLRFEDWTKAGQLTPSRAAFLQDAIKRGRHIFLVGEGDVGKTTFLNTCLKELRDTDDRLIIFDDTAAELEPVSKNSTRLFTVDTVGKPRVTYQDNIRRFLRMTGKRCAVNEIRDGETMAAVMQLFNTGANGCFTSIHSDMALHAYQRASDLLAEIGRTPIKSMIAHTMQVVVFLRNVDGLPRVTDVLETLGWDQSARYPEVREIA